MKKVSLLIVGALLTLATFSQEFMGIKVDGSKQQILSQFQSKGLKKKSEKTNLLILEGYVNGVNMEVFCSFTPKSEKCWKFTIWLPEQTSWYSIKTEYQKYVDIMKEKYGQPNNEYTFFSSPYYEGDGYEMSAISLEKCTYAAFWGTSYSVQISKFKQVKICYENSINSSLDDEERKAINSNTF